MVLEDGGVVTSRGEERRGAERSGAGEWAEPTLHKRSLTHEKAPRPERVKMQENTETHAQKSTQRREGNLFSFSYLPSGNPFSRLGPGALTDRETKTPQTRCSAPPPASLKGPAATRPSRAAGSRDHLQGALIKGEAFCMHLHHHHHLPHGTPNTLINLQ